MAGELRSRNAAFLIKLEASEGVDAAPAATDAMMVEEVVSGMGTSFIESTEITGALDAGAPAVIGAPTTWTMRARLRGVSGAALSASNLPPADPLLQIMGYERVVQAAIVAAALTGGTANSATLGTGFPSTAQGLRGFPLVFTGPDHAGHVGIVTDYTAGRVATLADTYTPALSATDLAAVPASIAYRPRSSGIPSATVYHYLDGILRKLVGARATGTIAMDAAGIPILSATITGIFAGESDAAIPAGINPSGIMPPLFVQSANKSPAFVMDRKPIGVANFSLDVGNSLTSPADPNTENGFGMGLLVARDTRLSINPQMELVATRNVFQQLQQGTVFPLVARAGSAVGNRLAIVAPQAQVIEAPDQDDGGILRRQMQLKLNGPDGSHFISFY